MIHVWGDKVRKCFVSTHSTTIPGRPSNKSRWREVLDEDGEEIGQSEVFNKTVKRKKVVETYSIGHKKLDVLYYAVVVARSVDYSSRDVPFYRTFKK